MAGFLAWGCGFDQRWVRFFCGGRMPPRLGQGPRFAWRFTKSWGHPVPTKRPTSSMPPTTEGRRGGQERGLPRYARPAGSLRLAISAALRFSCPHRNKTRRSRQTLPYRESISQVFDHHSTRGSSSLLRFQAAAPRLVSIAGRSAHAPGLPRRLWRWSCVIKFAASAHLLLLTSHFSLLTSPPPQTRNREQGTGNAEP